MRLNPRDLLVASTALGLLMTSGTARAADSCSAYPQAATEKIESVDLEKTFGAIPAAKPNLRFAYVTKTLINEFWQDVAAGVKKEASKYDITVDVQAAKDESSLVEQLNLAQTVLSQKPDALLISPQSDSNLAPVVEAAKAANIPTIIIDDARTRGRQHLYRYRPGGNRRARRRPSCTGFIPTAARSRRSRARPVRPMRGMRIQGFKDELAKYPNLTLVASQPGNWDRLTALNATSNILRQNPDLGGIYANNDGMALGVCRGGAAPAAISRRWRSSAPTAFARQRSPSPPARCGRPSPSFHLRKDSSACRWPCGSSAARPFRLGWCRLRR